MFHCQLLALTCRSSWAVFRSEVPQLPAGVGGRKKEDTASEAQGRPSPAYQPPHCHGTTTQSHHWCPQERQKNSSLANRSLWLFVGLGFVQSSGR